ncbi:MAG: hypothetical protein COV45_04790 [Deltaproteobacteria bacterium CG11_big_fil_rev_8_21_14_0_20_47_16]|nr:MAG: hypothetical protein COV45_04790 [Deltaproteobacteria bacterium CG11_big_fil_rev_8_21_14_0_20_47_16]
MQRRQLSKFLIITISLFGLLASPAVLHAATAKSSTTKHAKKSTKTTRRKKLPYVLAPKSDKQALPEEPHSHNFSPEFIQILVDGDLEQASRSLQMEEASDKVGYMINEVMRAQGKSMSHDHKIALLERAMANHNIYLFLQHQGRTVPRYAKEAEKYYKKTLRKSIYKNRANTLLAALYAAEGKESQAENTFNKVDVLTLIQDGNSYSGLEYVSLYYASQKNVSMALKYLYLAYTANPGLVLQWIHIGDDFWMIEDDPNFQKVVADWKIEHRKQLAQLKHDTETHAARKKAALTKKKRSVRKSKKKTR